MNTQTTIKSNEPFLNTNFFNNKEIKRVFVFNETGVLFESCNRWFGYGSNNDYCETTFNFEIKNKTKIDFKFKGSFFAKNSLYLNINDLDSDVYIVERFSTKYKTETQKRVDIVITGVDKRTNLKESKEYNLNSFINTEKTELQLRIEAFCKENNFDVSFCKQILENKGKVKEIMNTF